MNESSLAIRYGLFGLILSLVLVLGADLFPLLTMPDGTAWTPINSPLYRFGDNYYYAAWVHEVLESGIPPESPSAAEFSGKALMETLRWFPLAVAALPGYFIHDFRVVYVIDYAVTVLGFFGMPFLMTYYFTRRPLAALGVGFTILFATAQMWVDIPSAFGMPGAPRLWLWICILFGKVAHGSFELLEMFDYEALQGSFRYINLSISGPILMAYVIGVHFIYARAKPSVLLALALAVVSPFMAFSYPSQALIAYAALGGYGIMAFWRGHRLSAAILIGIGILAAVILYFGGYVHYMMDVFQQNALWNNIFHKESLTLRDMPWWQYPFMLLINKYTLTGGISIWLTWKNRELRDMLIVLLAIACGLSLTTIFEMPQLWGRFLGRGIDGVWFMAILIAGCYGLEPYLKKPVFEKLKYALLAFVLVIPTIAFGVYNYHTATNNTRTMPETRWAFLQWVDANTQKDETIAALNWDDITFIPIYSHANLMIDNMIIGGRGPEESLMRYVSLWKFLGLPRDLLQQRLTTMTELADRRLSYGGKPKIALKPPFISEPEYASAQIAEALIYWPYVEKVFDIEVAGKDKKVNPALVTYLMDAFDKMDAKAVQAQYPFAYVALSGEERNLPLKSAMPLEKIYENSTHIVYKVVKP